MTDWVKLVEDSSNGGRKLAKASPDAIKAFGGLMRESMGEGALDTKTKELMAVAIGVAVRCEGCIGHHVKSAIRAGASREELAETLAVTVAMGGGPSWVYAGQALEAYDQLSAAK